MEQTISTSTILPLTSTLSSVIPDQKGPSHYFSWYDYAIFGVLLSISMGMGLYFGCFIKNKLTTATDYLMGGKTMKVIPIVISLVASHSSGITLLAVPADVYVFGAGYILACVSILIDIAVTIGISLPVFHKLQLTSSYEYLGLRFDNRVRKCASVCFVTAAIVHMPVSVYIPALAFGAASGLNVNYLIPVICGICIFYTAIGGIKGLVWTDTIQFSLTFGVILVLLVLGVRDTGGIGNVFQSASETGRLDIFDMHSGFSQRESFWAILIGFSFNWIANNSFNQGCNQKFLSVPTLKKSKMVVVGYSVGMALVKTISVFSGLVMAARYSSCDPFVTNQIQRNDQLLPNFVLHITKGLPGLSGMFIAGVFSASLSHMSANLNALAGAVYEDFLRAPLDRKGIKNDGLVLKTLVVIAGVICTLLVYIIQHLGGLLSLGIGLGGIAHGPLIGMFLLGMLFPRANSKGAFYGALSGMAFMATAVYGSNYYKSAKILRYPHKTISVDSCDFFVNKTIADEEIRNILTGSGEDVFFLFRMSFYWYAAVGTAITVTIGLIISYLTEEPKVSKKLLSPLIYPLLGDKYEDEEPEYYGIQVALQRVNGEDQNDKTENIEEKRKELLRKMSFVSDTFDN